jgi:hypothetical protein
VSKIVTAQDSAGNTIPHGWVGRPNKGEFRNSLARAVFLHRLGEIRDRDVREPAAPRLWPEPPGDRDHPLDNAIKIKFYLEDL